MLIARLFQPTVQRFLIRSPYKSQEGLDHQIHVIQLVSLQGGKTGGNLNIFHVTANTLET